MEEEEEAEGREAPTQTAKSTLDSEQEICRTRKRKHREAEDDDDEEEEEIERKIEALQRIVPGGDELVCAEKLYEQTAGYILSLQSQIKAMKLLAQILQGFHKDMCKLN